MNYYLRYGQCVSADLQRNVYFHYPDTIVLSWRQFLNLNDVIMDMDMFRFLKYYPLGDHLWLQHHEKGIQLYNHRQKKFFTFHEESWKKYKRVIHARILSFLRHAVPSLQGCKHAPTHENLFKGESQIFTSKTSEKQVLSRETSNVGGGNEQQAECSNLSKWNSSNSRRPFSFIGAVHALGTSREATRDLEEGEVPDVELDCGQSSDFYSIE